MTAPVRIETKAWGDVRFTTLARLLGLADNHHALIKTALLWAWQAENFSPESPTYVVDQDTVESVLGPGAGAALVRAKLAEEVPEGFRICGAEGRIEWLWNARVAGRAGAEATKRKHANKRGPAGPGSPPATLNRTPGPLTLSLAPEEEDHTPAGAREGQSPAPPPLPPEPLGTREPVAPRRNPDVRRGKLASEALNYTARTQQQLKAEGIDPTAPNIGVTPNGLDYGWQQLLDRTQELLNTDPDTVAEVLKRRVDVAAAEARRDRTLRWFTTAALWTAKSFAIGASMSPEQASAPRAGPQGSGRFGDRHGADEPVRRIKTL